METIFKMDGYIADPHGAVGYLGLKKYGKTKQDFQGIFLETAHPVKFLNVVEPIIDKTIAFPTQIEAVMSKQKEAAFIKTYEELRDFLLI
jgi:threonine synthase